MLVIVISGTPGTGKTVISKILKDKLKSKFNTKLINLSEFAIKNNLIINYDKDRDTHVIDELKLKKKLKKVLKKLKKERENKVMMTIIESHFSELVPKKYINFAFVLRCDPEILYKRLERRGYKKQKILENVQSEILGTCTAQFLSKKRKFPLIEIDTSHLTPEGVVEKILRIIESKKGFKIKDEFGQIDWLEDLNQKGKLDKFFDTS